MFSNNLMSLILFSLEILFIIHFIGLFFIVFAFLYCQVHVLF